MRGPHVGKLKAQISSNQVGLLAYVKSNHPKVLEDIAAQGQLSPELDGQIKGHHDQVHCRVQRVKSPRTTHVNE